MPRSVRQYRRRLTETESDREAAMKKRKISARIVPGILCVLLGAVMYCWMTGMKPLGVGLVGFGGILLAFSALSALEPARPKAARFCRKALAALLAVFSAALLVTEVFILANARTDEDPSADYLIVLGAQVVGTQPSGVLYDRLKAAEAYLNAHPQTVAIVTGGQGVDEDISEAQCMADWLIAHGIGPQRILLETRATRTAENILYAKELIAGREEDTEQVRIAVLTSEFHLMRAKLLARWAGLDACGVAAPSANPAVLVSNCFREAFAVWNCLVFDRGAFQGA